MRKILPLLAAMALPLAACATSPYGYGYGYDRYGYSPIVGSVGLLGAAYGSSFTQVAASACANYASRYGAVGVTSVRRTDNDRVKVYGFVSRGYGSDDWDCTFRADGRISDFDI
jgi:hypothetical protein